MAKWRKAVALTRAERALLCEAALRLAQAWILLKFLPFDRMATTLGSSWKSAAAPDIRSVRWAVETAARNLPLPLTCLPQAFAACWMLAARGGRPLLRYGVAKTEEGYRSHAWVELDEHCVIGRCAAGRFTLLATFPGREDGSP
jgi:hypothetical protein